MNLLRYLQSNDQSILACEKYVHVRNKLVISNQKQSEDEEGSILENDVQKYVPNVNWAANFFGALAASQIILPFRRVLWWRHQNGELKQTPRPNGKNHYAEDFVSIYFFIPMKKVLIWKYVSSVVATFCVCCKKKGGGEGERGGKKKKGMTAKGSKNELWVGRDGQVKRDLLIGSRE